MGCCVDVPEETRSNEISDRGNAEVLKQPLSDESTPINEKQIIEIKVDDVDAWKYAESLTPDEVGKMLENISFDDCKQFIAPIKYAKVVKVYDGDTIHIVAPLFEGVMSRFRVRLNRIDAPELRTKDEWEKKAGYIVKEMLEEKIGNQIIELKDVNYDKYGRILADIILVDGAININEWLLDTQWVCSYNGKGQKLVKTIDWKAKVTQNHEL